MRVAVLQPHYLPYVGSLALIDVSDLFIIYDDVQFEKQSWQHRNRIRNQNDAMWLTVPVLHNQGQLINEVKIDNSKNWREKHWKSIQQNYSKTPYYKKYNERFEWIYNLEWNRLIGLNYILLIELLEQFKIKIPKMMKASEIETSGSKTDRLIPILKQVGATEFIEGMAGKDYLDVKKMNDNGIDVLWFDYQHPVYPQNGEFISHLSAIDLLFNVGSDGVEYIRQGAKFIKNA